MRCQRCGYDMEPGQTFCSMCGTEQAKAIRPSKKKIKSILGIIKITSMNHMKMWGNFALSLIAFFYILYACGDKSSQVAYLCLVSLLVLYTLFQCLLPYKNPNASKSKKYKLGMRLSFILILILMFVVIFAGETTLMDLVKRF